MNLNVAIDGPVSSGKGTIAKAVASRLSYVYVDTGAMYRTMALYFIRNNMDIKDEELVRQHYNDINVEIVNASDMQRYLLNGEDVTGNIREEKVGIGASDVSVYPFVREKMVELQQKLAQNTNVVMEGRDICTVVLPDAGIKVFLTASAEERARRRHTQLIEKGIDKTYDEVYTDLLTRDKQDTTREKDPLRQAEDAVLIDSTDIPIEGVVDKVMEIYNQRRTELGE